VSVIDLNTCPVTFIFGGSLIEKEMIGLMCFELPPALAGGLMSFIPIWL